MAFSLKQRALLALAPFPASLLVRGLAGSWRKSEQGATGVSPRSCGDKRFIYAYWHEYIMSLVGCYRDLPIHALASQSFDGELVSRFLLELGYPAPARGSSSRGGVGAIREMCDLLAQGNHVALTVDGPRGPRRVAQAGALKIAQISKKEVVPVGFASSSETRLRSWDKTLIPLPFSRAVFYFEDPIKVGEGEAELEAAHLRMQEKLDLATKKAHLALEAMT